ncbi:MAG TPA: NAD(P)-binding protein [Ferruginibacter sp.]|jgi:flavin-dependent dehydrogenase|nr:NAD(P)-binding protein [Ferruginibacter sp.]
MSNSGSNTHNKTYDVGILGGGLAGLSLAIQLAKKNHSVILFEKETYPFHKVCGEYISMESWDFIESLGVDLEKLNISHISQLQISAPNGKLLQHSLPLGGFGISRHLLDNTLVQIARSNGVIVKENTKITDIIFANDQFTINDGRNIYTVTMACGSFGKRSNLDVRWKRPFTIASKNDRNNYVGIKYHVTTDLPIDTISLHNFQNGYCGISKIEGDRYCLCYLTTADNLKKSNGNIKAMEQNILSQNPHLKNIFSTVTMRYDSPLTISQISFAKKSQVDNHILMIGDAAGMIAPLCGNGMSMALHGSKLASQQVSTYLEGRISRQEMEQQYIQQWHYHFNTRLKIGRVIQHLFGNKIVTNIFIAILRPFPRLVNYLIRQTHGRSF